MSELQIKRLLKMPDRSFFLFGPRSIGKSTWLHETMQDESYFDLLDTSLYLELSRTPGHLEALIGQKPPGHWVVLDEIQKVPLLLDEVQRLMGTHRWRFALCGSSARKLRRAHTNMLAGRAITVNMGPFSYIELGDLFDLKFSLDFGMLPPVQTDRKDAAEILSAYMDTYIKEEIREEGIVRQLPPFFRFLAIAGQLNAQIVNAQNVAREAAIPRSSVDNYFSILTDTMLGSFLPSWQPALKVRELAHPKFYWFDPGVARAAAGWLREPTDRAWKGFALETLLLHELRVYNEISRKQRPISYYKTQSGGEIDFVVETGRKTHSSPARVVCIEAKLSDKWDRQWEGPMRDIHASEKIKVDRMVGVYTGNRRWHFDGLDVLPVEEFLGELHMGKVF